MVLQYQGNKKSATFNSQFCIKINTIEQGKNTISPFLKAIKQILDAI
jgi:hypothetical protein